MFLTPKQLESAIKHFYKEYMYFEIDKVYYLEICYTDFDMIQCEQFPTHEDIKKEIDNDPYGTLE